MRNFSWLKLLFLSIITIPYGVVSFAQPQKKDTRGVPKTVPAPRRYVEELKIYVPTTIKNIGLQPYYDYDEALAASRRLNRPVMVDFTGTQNPNSRMMEKRVWADPRVAMRLKDDFIVVSLYCDMRNITLPEGRQYYSSKLNKKVVTLGDKNCDLQMTQFGSESQPNYYFVDGNGKKLVEEGYSYDADVQKFVDYLEKVKAKYKNGH